MTLKERHEGQCFAQALRELTLPILPSEEPDAVERLRAFAESAGIGGAEIVPLVRSALRKWDEQNEPGRELRSLVSAALGDGEGHRIGGAKYFEIGFRLAGSPHHLTPAAIRQILLDLPQIQAWRATSATSASRIAQLLSAMKPALPLSWMALRDLLSCLGDRQTVSTEDLKATHAADLELEEMVFADAPLRLAMAQVGEMGKAFNFRGDLPGLLESALPLGTPNYAVAFILQFQLLHLEQFDCSPSFAYEFNPRGEFAKWLIKQYPPLIVGGKEPFLNIAKGAYRLTEDWALPRNDARACLSLAKIFSGLEELSYTPRRELAAFIRRLVARILKALHGGGGDCPIPDPLPPGTAFKIIESICQSPTQTFGILEQRLLDSVAASLLRKEDGWRATTIYHSINATNLSALKFGDCEFIHSSTCRIRAFESHAAHLTRAYVDDHIDTAGRFLERRLKLLEQQIDTADLKIEVQFIAHSLSPDLQPETVELDTGTIRQKVSLEYRTFADLVGRGERNRAS
ncbi:MAG: hypothetical protein R3F11_05310 [Verrucomicrobiales bacterium]